MKNSNNFWKYVYLKLFFMILGIPSIVISVLLGRYSPDNIFSMIFCFIFGVFYLSMAVVFYQKAIESLKDNQKK